MRIALSRKGSNTNAARLRTTHSALTSPEKAFRPVKQSARPSRNGAAWRGPALPLQAAKRPLASGDPVLHSNTQALIEEWRTRRGSARLPLRTDLSPAAFGPLLPQLFVLGLDAGKERLRLAGGLLHDLHGRELRGLEFASLWAGMDRARIAAAIADSRRTARPVVLRAQGVTAEGAALGLEIAVCPLIGPTDLPDRTIGLYQPTSLTARLLGRAIERLHLTAVEPVDEPQHESRLQTDAARFPAPTSARAALRLVIDNSRRVA